MPAQSPTLSPTLSAMTPAFRGSSSGIPASILPTRSAPTSAALVNIPPPTLANRLMRLAPNPKPMTMSTLSGVAPNRIKKPLVPSSARPTTAIPVTAPPLKATSMASLSPSLALFAVLTFALTETFMPIYPASAELTAPAKNPIVVFMFKLFSFGSTMKMITASITATMAMVLYWRFRYAIAPSCIAAAIFCISGVPGSFLSTFLAKIPANTRLNNPARGARYNNVDVSIEFLLFHKCY